MKFVDKENKNTEEDDTRLIPGVYYDEVDDEFVLEFEDTNGDVGALSGKGVNRLGILTSLFDFYGITSLSQLNDILSNYFNKR